MKKNNYQSFDIPEEDKPSFFVSADIIKEAPLPTFFRWKIRRARKSHLCTECNCFIDRYTLYEYAVGKWSGEFKIFKTCEKCLDIRDKFFLNGWVFGQIISDFINYIRSVDGRLSQDIISQLPPMAQGFVCDLIDEYWRKNTLK